jgi:hypothetical protein
MKEQDMGRCKFQYSLNHLTFDCLFFIDIEPFELAMGCIEHNIFILKNIEKGFQIEDTRIEPAATFWALVNALKTGAYSDERFNPFKFFVDFNRAIPRTTSPNNRPTTQDVIRYYSDIEESEKIYFCGWLDNSLQKNNVTPENLFKTKMLMGERASAFSERRNQSTKWTHIQRLGQDFYIPD